jgi:WD40 repeat protein
MKYNAFISYSHAADGKLAPALQNALHKFAKPWYKKRALHVFRDETTLSITPELWRSIESALNESEYFILLASPDAMASKWVQQEISYWLSNKNPHTFLIALTDGQIIWNNAQNDFDWIATTALPENLKGSFDQEPLYVDLRKQKSEDQLTVKNPEFLNEVATLAAKLHGISKDEIIGEDIRQHRITKLLVRAIGITFFTLFGLVIYGFIEAKQQRDIAIARKLSAQAESFVNLRGDLLETASLLAVEGMKRAPSLEADRALRKTLALLPKRISEMDCAAAGEVYQASFSSDGNLLTTVTEKGDANVWETTTGRRISSFNTSEKIRKVIISPNRQHVVTVSDAIRIWNTKDGTEVTKLPITEVRDATYSGNGLFFATVSTDSVTRLWDAKNYSLVATYQNSQPMQFVALLPDASEITTWNQEIAEVFRSPGAPQQTIQLGWSSVAFGYSPNGEFLTMVDKSGAGGYQFKLFEVKTHKQLLFDDHNIDFAFSQDGWHFAVASPEWVAEAYDLKTCRQSGITYEIVPGTATVKRQYENNLVSCHKLPTVHHDDSVWHVALNQDGRYLGTQSADRTLRVWETYRGREVLRIVEEVEGLTPNIAFIGDGRLLSGWGSKKCRSWESTGHRQIIELPHEDSVNDVSFSSDGRYAVTGSGAGITGGRARVWELSTGREVGEELELPHFVTRVSISPDTQKILVGQSLTTSEQQSWQIWDVATKTKQEQVAHSEHGEPLLVSDDWKYIVEKRNKNGIAVLEFNNGKELANRSYNTEIKTVTMSRDACCIVSVLEDNSVQLWRWKDGKDVANMKLGYAAKAPIIDTTNKYLAIINGDDAKNVDIWKIAESTLEHHLVHNTDVYDIAFHPNGKYLASASKDNGARIWDLKGNQVIAELQHDDYVRSVAFSPDGKYVLSGGGRSDRKARLWFWQPLDLIAEACSRLHRNLTPEEWEQYIGSGNNQPTCPLDKKLNL